MRMLLKCMLLNKHISNIDMIIHYYRIKDLIVHLQLNKLGTKVRHIKPRRIKRIKISKYPPMKIASNEKRGVNTNTIFSFSGKL